MKRLSTAILAIGIALVFVLYMVTYTVGYNEIAIVTTFDKAKDADAKLLAEGKDTGSVMQQPGLKWKWPWPIQQVRTFPTQMQVLQDKPEQILLKDSSTVIIGMSLAWRIDNPLVFYRQFNTVEQAEKDLSSQLANLRSFVSEYSLDSLVNPDKTLLRRELENLEKRLVESLRQQLAKTYGEGHGISVKQVTIGKLLYTGSTVESVNKRMSSTQQRLAESIRSTGNSTANSIVADAESKAKQLQEFADNVAKNIISDGKREKSYYIKRYADSGNDPDLAIFLRQMEALEKTLGSRTTFVLDARMFTPFDVFVYGHGKKGNISRMLNKDGKQSSSRPTPLLPETNKPASANAKPGDDSE